MQIETPTIDPENQKFPFCIVWTTLPLISWILPIIGHTGICKSNGVIYDFLGYTINSRHMAFGNPIKYVKLDFTNNQAADYDMAVSFANDQFGCLAHNLCSNNCHHHVAAVLNYLGYRNRRDWNQMSIWWMCLIQSKYVNKCSILRVYLPLIIIATIIILLCLLIK